MGIIETGSSPEESKSIPSFWDISREKMESVAMYRFFEFRTDYDNEPWSYLSYGQLERAREVGAVLAEQFGISTKNIALLKAHLNPYGDRSRFFLTHTDAEGLDLGNPEESYDKKRSYEDIKGKVNDRRFTFSAGGQWCDSRVMSTSMYEDLVRYTESHGLAIPDYGVEENGKPITYTLLSGQEARPVFGGSPMARAIHTKKLEFPQGERIGIVVSNINVKDQEKKVRFRPTVVIDFPKRKSFPPMLPPPTR